MQHRACGARTKYTSRKREIALRGGTRDYTQEGLELCRYCYVVRSGRTVSY